LSPSFTPPVVNDRSPIYLQPDRFYPVTRVAERLMRHYGGQPRGQTVLKIDGVYQTVSHPSQSQIDAASEVYLGGHVHDISQETADALTAAGYVVGP
jgi:hypothetical protein